MQTNSTRSQSGRLRMIRASFGVLLTTLGIIGVSHLVNAAAAEPAASLNPPLTGEQSSPGGKTERAVFAGGCFWGVQAVFSIPRA